MSAPRPLAAVFAALLVSATLASAPPATAAQNSQLIRSVEQRLAIIGFGDVDASTLSTSQLAALHLRLQGKYTFGLNRVRARQEVKVILDWEN